MSGLFVPQHVAAQRKSPPVDIGKTQMRDLAMSPEKLAEVMGKWDVEPIGQRIFVAPIVRDLTAGGIVVPDTSADMSWDGVIVAAGPLAFVHRGRDIASEEVDAALAALGDSADGYAVRSRLCQYLLQPGDKVNFARWSGEKVKRWHLDCPPLLVMNADDCIGMLKE